MRALAIIAIAVTSLAAISPETGLERSVSAATPTRVTDTREAKRGPIQGVLVMVDFEERAAVDLAVQTYLDGVHAQNLDRLYAEVTAELVRQAAAEAEARAAAARRPVPTQSHPGTTDGACTGFSIPSYIIQRESGGNPSAYNPSGAYGCAQTLLSHYSSGSCRGLDPYTIEGQRACVDILSAGGTNLSPWAQTR